MIPKKEVEYEYKSHSNITVSNLDEKIDLGVTVIGIFAGLNFWIKTKWWWFSLNFEPEKSDEIHPFKAVQQVFCCYDFYLWGDKFGRVCQETPSTIRGFEYTFGDSHRSSQQDTHRT